MYPPRHKPQNSTRSCKAPLYLIVALALAGCSKEPANTQQLELAEAGRVIAEQNCAGCHSIASTGASPNTAAPPLRIALQDFDIEALAIDFREHIEIGSNEMPEFDFGTKGTDALMAYLLTLETTQGE